MTTKSSYTHKATASIIGKIISPPQYSKAIKTKGHFSPCLASFTLQAGAPQNNIRFNVTAYGKLAETVMQYLAVGNTVLVEGSLTGNDCVDATFANLIL